MEYLEGQQYNQKLIVLLENSGDIKHTINEINHIDGVTNTKNCTCTLKQMLVRPKISR